MTHRLDDRGAGLIGVIGGVLVFFTLLTFAVQLLFNLYATSAITAAAHDAAHHAASGRVDRDDPVAIRAALESAEERARAVLGRYGDRVRFTWEVDDDWVRLTTAADHPSLALHGVAGAFGLNRTERTVEVRVEQPR
jgi:hypothetical protein